MRRASSVSGGRQPAPSTGGLDAVLAAPVAAVLLFAIIAGGCRERAPSLLDEIARRCPTYPCRIRMDAVVPDQWDTLWASEGDYDDLFPATKLLDAHATPVRGGLGGYNVMFLSLNGRVVWEDSCYNNLDEIGYPPPKWDVAMDNPGRAWLNVPRAQAEFVVEQVGVDRRLTLAPLSSSAPPGPQ